MDWTVATPLHALTCDATDRQTSWTWAGCDVDSVEDGAVSAASDPPRIQQDWQDAESHRPQPANHSVTPRDRRHGRHSSQGTIRAAQLQQFRVISLQVKLPVNTACIG